MILIRSNLPNLAAAARILRAHSANLIPGTISVARALLSTKAENLGTGVTLRLETWTEKSYT
jgi:hypothetical protein